MNILEKMKDHWEKLSKSERKVAEAILRVPHEAMHSSIAALAQLAGVSEPTVNRFCRRLETKGFPDLKLHLAQCLANSPSYVSRHIEQNDGPETYCAKIFESSIACLDAAKASLDPLLVNRCVDLLTQARRIYFFALGGSSAVARDAQNKFLRFNMPVMSFADVAMMRMSALNCSSGDVVVLISRRGQQAALIEMAQLARAHQATVMVITAPDSALASAGQLLLPLCEASDDDIYMPMASRLAQMTLIDVLATGFALRRGAQTLDHLKRVDAGLQAHELASCSLC
ncbi:MAG: transcriptional regulator HexR [Aeromonas sp.]